MSKPDGRPSRRGVLASAGGLLALAGSASNTVAAERPASLSTVDFWGARQAGITTPQQIHTYFMAFDLIAANRAEVVDLLRAWTQAASRLTAGQTSAPIGKELDSPGGDSAEALGLNPARLTITFGFGPGVFIKDGVDRYGVAPRRPEALIDLPRFAGPNRGSCPNPPTVERRAT